MEMTATNTTDKQLVALFNQTGDVAHIGRLFENNRSYLRNLLIQKGFLDVADTIQNAYIRIQRAFLVGLYNPDTNGSVRTWMFRIAQNEAIDETRRARAKEKIKAVSLDVPVGADKTLLLAEVIAYPTINTDVFGLDREELPSVIGLYKLIPRLNKNSQYIAETAMNYRLMGFQFNEVSAITGINSNSLRGAWARDVKKMREMFLSGIRNPAFTEADMLEIELRGKELRKEHGL